MARTKQTAKKHPKTVFATAAVASKLLWCPEPGCLQYYRHRQSLHRHRDRVHGRLAPSSKEAVTSSPQLSDNSRVMAVMTSPTTSFEELLRYMDNDEVAANSDQDAAWMDDVQSSTAAVSMDEALEQEASAQSTFRSAATGVVPMKEMRTTSSRQQPTADGIARRWMTTPAVSTGAVYGMLQDMAAYTPFSIAATAQRRFGLSDPQRGALRRRLSAAALTERTMAAEVRQLLPVGAIDGNTALATLYRIEAWLLRHEQRPLSRVNE